MNAPRREPSRELSEKPLSPDAPGFDLSVVRTDSVRLIAAMLELRPTCENCNKPLPPDSAEARICSYECTFCAPCVDQVLGNVCPNCAGGFTPRPVRPVTDWKGGNHLAKDPAGIMVKHRPVDPAAHARFAEPIRPIPPEKR